MKPSTILASLAATTFVFASAAVFAQDHPGGGQQGGGQQQMQQQKKRQAERAMSQDRAMDQQRMLSRERTQDHEQAHVSKGPGEGIYGGNLMTVQERNQYRAELGALKTDEERLQYQARHRDKMQRRAKERGIEPETTSD